MNEVPWTWPQLSLLRVTKPHRITKPRCILWAGRSPPSPPGCLTSPQTSQRWHCPVDIIKYSRMTRKFSFKVRHMQLRDRRFVQSPDESGQDGGEQDNNPKCPARQVRQRGTLTPQHHWSPIKMHDVSFPNLLLKNNKPHIPKAALSHLEIIFPGMFGGGIFKYKFSSSPGTAHWLNAVVSLREGYWASVCKIPCPEAAKSRQNIWPIHTSTILSKGLLPLHSAARLTF